MDLPDILVFLNIDLVKLSFDWRYDVCLHLHGHMLRQDRQQQPLLQAVEQCVAATLCQTFTKDHYSNSRTQGPLRFLNPHCLQFGLFALRYKSQSSHIIPQPPPLIFHVAPGHKWRIYYIIGRAFMFPVDIRPFPVLSAIFFTSSILTF